MRLLSPPRAATLAALAALPVLVFPSSARAQDVEQLARIWGTTVPAGYYETRARYPDAFRFGRALKGMARRGEIPLVTGGASGSASGGAGSGGTVSGAPADGIVRIPVVMGLYSNSDSLHPGISATVDSADMQREFFDGPNSYYRTLTDLYDEMSGGRLTLTGDVHGWRETDLPRSTVLGNSDGLGTDAYVGDYIVDVLEQLDSAGVDWSRYDSDGDAYVDVVAVLHPDEGAECDGPGIWAHRWTIRSARQTGTGPFITGDTAASGTPIAVDDYVVIPALSCFHGDDPSRTFGEIGVLSHELGHAFGLPDLYDTSGNQQGIGSWGLMGSGNWGCDHGSGTPVEPARPCHMGAWSKGVLGWAPVETLEPGRDHGTVTLDPVETGGRVLRVDARDGSGDFYLLENRQRIGFDAHLHAPGVLVWRVDQEKLNTVTGNTVNTDPDRLGVGIVQADGRRDLQDTGNGGRGDPGDIFPGSTGQEDFHAGTDPPALSHLGSATGLTVLGVGPGAGDRMGFRALTVFRSVAVEVEGASAGALAVDGGDPVALPATLEWAPFEGHTLEGAPTGETSPGVRSGFEGWADGASAAREFAIALADTSLTALYGTEYRADVSLEGGVNGVDPGEIAFTPASSDGWFPAGTDVEVRAEPITGFAFRRWSGDVTGAANPVPMTMDGPAALTAEFDLTYGITGTRTSVEFPAATEQELVFEAEHANEPVSWTLTGGAVPAGMIFRSDGILSGAAMEAGSFSVTVMATDAVGLEASAGIDLEVATPPITGDALAGPFLGTGTGPSGLEERFLDRAGNGNGRYDLADLRAFVIDNPVLAETRVPTVLRRVITVDFPGHGGEERP